MNKLKKLLFDSIRIYLAIVFFVYAKNKLLQDQFKFSPQLLETPVKDVSLFDLQWYIYSFEPFNYFIGLTQIITVCLLLYRKTVFLGAISFLVIIINILIIDISVMEGWIRVKMVSKVTFLLALVLVLLSYYKAEIKQIISLVYISKIKKSFSLRYIILTLICAVILNCLSIFPKYFYYLFTEPSKLYAVFKYDILDSIHMFSLVLKNYLK